MFSRFLSSGVRVVLVGLAMQWGPGMGEAANSSATAPIAGAGSPVVTAVGLPGDGESGASLVGRFAVAFSEPMAPATVLDPSQYELVLAGPNGNFDGEGRSLYTLVPEPFSGGSVAILRVADGPLQPGLHRLTLRPGLTDVGGNALAAAYRRTFLIEGLGSYVNESRSNGEVRTATPLGGEEAGPTGGFRLAEKVPLPGAIPHEIESADFDRDGRGDLATTLWFTGHVAILGGRGDGSFREPLLLPTEAGPISLATGDMNGDGLIDVAVANNEAGSVGIHLGDGSGGFAPPVNVPVAPLPERVRACDLDGDGRSELVVVSHWGFEFGVVRRGADGTYATTQYFVPEHAVAIACGDVTGDGRAEVVVGNEGGRTFLNDGTGVLRPGLAFGVAPQDLALADLDRDGRTDLIVLQASRSWVEVLWGQGDGSFGPAEVHGNFQGAGYYVKAVDLNQDGWLDILVSSTSAVAVHRIPNLGGRRFGESESLAGVGANYGTVGVVAGDWNHDGWLDLATATYYEANVAIWLADRERPLREELPGVFTGAGRGFLADSTDQDYWSFGARPGDVFRLAVELPENPGGKRHYFEVLRPDGQRLTEFWGRSTPAAWGQSLPLVLPMLGTYTVRVAPYEAFEGEYRLRVMLARDGIQVEDETGNNDSPDQADRPVLRATVDGWTARVHGYLGAGDSAGDYFRLGYLAPGVTVDLGLQRPAGETSVATPVLWRRRSGADTIARLGAASATALQHTVAAGEQGEYFAQVRAGDGAGLMADYLLTLGVRDMGGPTVLSCDLPGEGATSEALIDRVSLLFDEALQPATAVDSANFELRCSANETFGDLDDTVYALVADPYSEGTSLGFAIPEGPLRPGRCRFTIRTGLMDGRGNPLAAPFVRTFRTSNPPGYALETAGNNSLETASPLGNPASGSTEDPVGVWTGLGRGRLSVSGDVDYWNFPARAGDRLIVAVATPGNPSGSQLIYRVERADRVVVTEFLAVSANGWGQSGVLTLPYDGTYALSVRQYQGYQGEYRLRATLIRGGLHAENENLGNDSTAKADHPVLDVDAGVLRATVCGYLGTGDVNGDYFGIGYRGSNNVVSLTVRRPASSAVEVGLEILRSSDGSDVVVARSAPGATTLVHTVPAAGDGEYFVRVQGASGVGLTAQYLLDFAITAPEAPAVIGTDLPAQGASTTAVLDRFEVGFSQVMDGAAVLNPAHYDLRSSGNGIFGDADDAVYAVSCSLKADGLNAVCTATDGPLQPGDFRLTIGTGLADVHGHRLAAEFVRSFRVDNVEGFTLENRGNDVPWSATPLAANTREGDLRVSASYPVGTDPRDVVAADFNRDHVPDLAVVAGQSDIANVFVGQGDGSFRELAGVGVGRRSLVEAGDVNRDGNADLVAAGGSSGIVVVIGRGDGTFGGAVNIDPAAEGVTALLLVDLDGDGTPEILTTSGTHRVLRVYRRGAVGGYTGAGVTLEVSADGLAAADFNRDGHPDVAVVSEEAGRLTVLPGDGVGGFRAPRLTLLADVSRHVVAARFDADDWTDLAVANPGKHGVTVLRGVGDGTFGSPRFRGVPGQPRALLVADTDTDGDLDLVVATAGTGPLALVPNLGDGAFGDPRAYTPSAVIGLAAGDWNGNGRTDLVTLNPLSSRATVWLSLRDPALYEDIPGVQYGQGRGTLSGVGDHDYWSFEGKAGDRVVFAAEVPAGSTELSVTLRLERSGGDLLTEIHPGTGGGLSAAPVVLPADGTYYLHVSCSALWVGEYRFRLSLLRDGYQAETERNDLLSQANALAFGRGGGFAWSGVAGLMDRDDSSSGDAFGLGGISEGTTIELSCRLPSDSRLVPILDLYNASGRLVASSRAPGDSPVVYAVPPGGGGVYSASIRPGLPGSEGPEAGKTPAFRGGDASIEIPLNVSETMLSVSLWFISVRPDAGLFQVAAQRHGAKGHDRHIALLGGDLQAAIHSSETIRSSGLNLADGRWHHVVYEYGPSIAGQRLYVDGLLCAQGTKASSDFNWDDRLEIGFTGGWPGLWGSIATVGLWDHPLTESEIDVVRAAGPAGVPAGRLGFWPLTEGSGTTVRDAGGAGPPGTFVGAVGWEMMAPAFAKMGGLDTAYALEVKLAENGVPRLTAIGLPAEGSTVEGIIDRISVGFSEEMDPESVLEAGAYELRAAGADGEFGGADDVVHRLRCLGYTSGLAATYLIESGALRPGRYRFTAGTRLRDRVGLTLAAPVIREFAVASRPGFVQERPDNDSFGGGTSLSPAPSAVFDGTFAHRFSGSLGAGVSPHAIQAGDLNGDGRPDLVTANYDGGSIGVFLGNGDGTFRGPVTYAMGGLANDLLLRDFNRDGKLDAVTPNYGGNNVTIRLGIGDGTFGGVVVLASGGNPNGIAAGDFDEDGLWDLAVGNRTRGDVSLLRGNGDGTFGAAVFYRSAWGASRVTVEDLNGDGHSDLAVANYTAGSVGLLFGDGTGRFGVAGLLPAAGGPYAIHAGDLNGDRVPDLAVVTISTPGLSVLFGTGGGAFAAPVNYTTGGRNPYHVLAADLTADGYPDLLLSDYHAEGAIRILPNHGEGTFLEPKTYATASGAVASVVGDWNGDGRPDIAVANFTASVVSVFLGNGSHPIPPATVGFGVRVASGYGNLTDASDLDYFLFSARAGDVLMLASDAPSAANDRRVTYRIVAFNGQVLAELTPGSNGAGETKPVVAPLDGIYAVRVSASGSYLGEYRFRVMLGPPGASGEREPNPAPASATPLNWTQLETGRQATALGVVGQAGDVDYFGLGFVDAGLTVVARVRPLGETNLAPTVTVRGSTQGIVPEVVPNRAPDEDAEVRIPVSGQYFLQVAGVLGQGGLLEQYVLEVLIGNGSGSAPRVVARRVFYDQSAWDLAGDDAAMAPDKSPLLPGQKAGFANYTSYSRGLNGIVIDLASLPGEPGIDDFEFRSGNTPDPTTWSVGPSPAGVAVRWGAGIGGSDRVVLSWQANAVRKAWLQVTVRATPATGLAEPDVFYFGNAVGETGNSTTDARVTSADALRVLGRVKADAAIDEVADINRDGRVGAADRLIVLGNVSALDPLILLDLSAAGAGLAGAGGAAGLPKSSSTMAPWGPDAASAPALAPAPAPPLGSEALAFGSVVSVTSEVRVGVESLDRAQIRVRCAAPPAGRAGARLEWSTDGRCWEPAPERAEAEEGGVLRWTVPVSPGSPSRFFRVAWDLGD